MVREMTALLAPTEDEGCNLAKDLARRLHGHVPLVYGAGLSAPAARRWKTQLNENAKAMAFWAELPELDHNEIEAWAAWHVRTRRPADGGRLPPRWRRGPAAGAARGADG